MPPVLQMGPSQGLCHDLQGQPEAGTLKAIEIRWGNRRALKKDACGEVAKDC